MTSSYSFLKDAQVQQLIANGRLSQDAASRDELFDPPPVVKLFTPAAGATWLLAEIDPDDPTIAFGLCDLGLGFPELGYVSLDELATVRGSSGLPVEQDQSFRATQTLSGYARGARAAGRLEA